MSMVFLPGFIPDIREYVEYAHNGANKLCRINLFSTRNEMELVLHCSYSMHHTDMMNMMTMTMIHTEIGALVYLSQCHDLRILQF